MTATITPIANGPLVHVHRQAGATMEIVDGWEVAVGYPSKPQRGANTLIDLSHRKVNEFTGPQTGAAMRLLCGSESTVRAIHVSEDFEAYRLTDARAIVFGRANVSDAIDVTGGWSSLALFGPDVRTILNKITALDLREQTLPAGHCCQGPIFGINALFGHFENRYELHVCPDVMQFLWEVTLDAGHEFQLRPAGLESYQQASGVKTSS